MYKGLFPLNLHHHSLTLDSKLSGDKVLRWRKVASKFLTFELVRACFVAVSSIAVSDRSWFFLQGYIGDLEIAFRIPQQRQETPSPFCILLLHFGCPSRHNLLDSPLSSTSQTLSMSTLRLEGSKAISPSSAGTVEVDGASSTLDEPFLRGE